MDSVEKIASVIPKLKYQLAFLRQREILMKMNDDCSIQNSSPSPVSLNISAEITPLVQIASNDSAILCRSSEENKNNSDLFPDKYKIPPMPAHVIEDIEKGDLANFGPHCSNRQVLIDIIAHDLINKHHLLYPTKRQFDTLGVSIVNFLKLSVTKNNIAIWKDTLQSKLKIIRSQNPDNDEVKLHQVKYARQGSGRPIKKRVGETARRDNQKRVVLAVYDESTLMEMNKKAETLRDFSQLDINKHINLWNETLHVRRKYISQNSTSDIITNYPGYSFPVLIFEEVKSLVNIDLSISVRQQIPILLDKVPSTPMFLTDSPATRLVKILCREFDETFQHMFSNTEPSTPYPTMVFTEDLINIYVDFLPITATTSSDDALALLIAMYTIFELNFPKNNRVVRLLYSLLHREKRFLTNTIRLFMKEKNIEMLDQSSIEQENFDKDKSANNILGSAVVSDISQDLSTKSSPIIDQLDRACEINPANQSQEQFDKNECAENSQSIRKPLANRTNLNNKRCLRSTEKQADEDTNSNSISSTKPKPKRRRH